MSIAVIGLVDYMDAGLDEDILSEKDFQARKLAESGITLALHPQIQSGDPLLAQSVSAAKSYRVTMTNEGARIAVNRLPALPELRRVCRDLFERWGLDLDKSTALVDALSDWVDPDSDARIQGAENDYYVLKGYPELPGNRAFQSLEQLLFVPGMEDLDQLKPDWRDAFTLHGDGKIDIHEAPWELLSVLLITDGAYVDRVIKFRLGADGIRYTDDDERFEDLDQVQDFLQLEASRFMLIEPLLTLNHPIRRIESTGTVNDYSKTLIAIIGPGIRFLREKPEIRKPVFTAALAGPNVGATPDNPAATTATTDVQSSINPATLPD